MIYERPIQIEFNHCDPAGIVFYPRYFEMINSVVENFFKDVVGRSFAAMLSGAQNGVPTVALEAQFMAPSRLGETILFSLQANRLGTSSLGLTVSAHLADALRLRANLTLVWTDQMKATPWPPEMRARLSEFMEIAA
jgi:4-hydroxybenzoyl-CoA thioesterase